MKDAYEALKVKMEFVGLSLIPYEKIGTEEEIKLYIDTQSKIVDKVFKQKNVFPVRTHIGKDCNRRWITSVFGNETKQHFRDIAKRTDMYGVKIVCPVYGSAAENNHIPINNVGKWFFGTPGYKANCVFKEVNDVTHKVEILWSKDAPEIVTELVDKAIEEWRNVYNC